MNDRAITTGTDPNVIGGGINAFGGTGDDVLTAAQPTTSLTAAAGPTCSPAATGRTC